MQKVVVSLLSIFFVSFSYDISAQQLPRQNTLGAVDFLQNPGMTATGEFLDFGAFFSQQWLGFDGAPVTGYAYLQYPFVYQNMSVGAALGYDQVGPLKKTDFSATYCYKIPLKNAGQLSIGVLATIGEYRLDQSEVLAYDNNDVLISGETFNDIAPNFGLGFFYISNLGMYDFEENSFFVGISSGQMLPDKLDLGRAAEKNFKRVIHANTVMGYRVQNNLGFLEPSLRLSFASENIIYGTVNLNFEIENTFWSGLSFSSDTTVGVQSGVVLNEGFLQDGQLKIGILGSYNMGGKGRYQGVSFESWVAYRFGL